MSARRVITWDSMTPFQRAEHLVYGHGYDKDYYEEQGLTNAEVVDRFVHEVTPKISTENYPWPSTGAHLHTDDHEHPFTDWPDLAHDHDKAGTK